MEIDLKCCIALHRFLLFDDLEQHPTYLPVITIKEYIKMQNLKKKNEEQCYILVTCHLTEQKSNHKRPPRYIHDRRRYRAEGRKKDPGNYVVHSGHFFVPHGYSSWRV